MCEVVAGELPISEIADLLKLPDLKFGTMRDSALEEAFKYTEYVPFQMMWQRMRSFPEQSLVPNVDIGEQRVSLLTHFHVNMSYGAQAKQDLLHRLLQTEIWKSVMKLEYLYEEKCTNTSF